MTVLTTKSSLPQSIAVLGGAGRAPTLPPHLAALTDSHIGATPFGSLIAAFAATPYERLAVDVGYVEAAQRAASEGARAIFIDSFADYGIAAMRAVLPIPIVGAGEAALEAAAAGHRRYAIVTVWPQSMAFLYEERLRMMPAGAGCVDVIHVSPETELERLTSDAGVMQRMARREDAIVAQLVDVCEQVAKSRGVDAIVLGCTCMAPIGPAIQARVDIPIIEPSRVGFQAAIEAVRRGDRHDIVVAPSRRSLISDLVAGAPLAKSEEACPVCIVTAPT